MLGATWFRSVLTKANHSTTKSEVCHDRSYKRRTAAATVVCTNRREEKKVDPSIGHDWPQAPTINTACQAFNQLSANFLGKQASCRTSPSSTREGCGPSVASRSCQHHTIHRGANCALAGLHAKSLHPKRCWSSNRKREHDSKTHDELQRPSGWDRAPGSLPFAVSAWAEEMHFLGVRPLPKQMQGEFLGLVPRQQRCR